MQGCRETAKCLFLSTFCCSRNKRSAEKGYPLVVHATADGMVATACAGMVATACAVAAAVVPTVDCQ